MTVKTHVFMGRKYTIHFDQPDGSCDNIDGSCDQYKAGPEGLEMTILVDLMTFNGLETTIHEALHACNWRKGEGDVTRAGNDIARFLWRLGWRKVK